MPGRRDKWTGEDDSYQHIAGDLDPGPPGALDTLRYIVNPKVAPSPEIVPSFHTKDAFTKNKKGGLDNATMKRARDAILNMRAEEAEMKRGKK